MATSQFFGLNIAASGLRAANAALNTTANNISNVSTTGYSRQTVEQQASDALRMFTRYGAVGAGVDTIAIERVRDEFYDNKYRSNEALYGEYSQKNYYNQLIEQYFEDDGNTGFSALFNKMEAALQSTINAAGTTSTKTAFVASVQSVADYFNTMYGNLEKEQSDINEEIKTSLDSINSIAQQIASLNEQINVVEMTGAKANELRDKRDVLIDDLSKLTKVETKESKVIDSNDPDRDTGLTRFQVFIAGGQNLVDEYEYRQLICIARTAEDAVNQSDVTGLYDVKWVRSDYQEGSRDYAGEFRLDNPNIGGSLKGLLEMRDGNNGQYFHGTSGAYTGVPDANGAVTVTIDTTADYLKDMNKCVLPPEGNITIGSRTYHYNNWEVTADGTYTFTLPAKNTDGDKQDFSKLKNNSGDTVRVGGSVDYQGIPYYMEQMNEWIRNFSASVNKIMEQGYTSDGLQGTYLLTGTKDRSGSSAQFTYEELTTTTKGYYDLTARNFAVNDVIVDNADRLATKADLTEGTDEPRTLKALNDMFGKADIFRGATSGEFLEKVLADVSLNTSNSRTMESTYLALENTIDNQRLSESGVDEDEEAANLIQYQHAYQLASKMIQTFQEIYDRLILQTGV